MPLFEFICKNCGKKFEKIIFSINKEIMQCPDCKSKDIEKQFSLFSSGKSCSRNHCSDGSPSLCQSKKTSGQCGGCCGM